MLYPRKPTVAFLAWPKLVRHCQSAFSSWLGRQCIPCIRPTTSNTSQSVHFGQVLSGHSLMLKETAMVQTAHKCSLETASVCFHYKKQVQLFYVKATFQLQLTTETLGHQGFCGDMSLSPGTVSVVCTCDKQVCNTSSNLISSFESKCAARCNQKEHAEQKCFPPEAREVVACQKKIWMRKSHTVKQNVKRLLHL